MRLKRSPSKKTTEELLKDLNLPEDIKDRLSIEEKLIQREEDDILTFLRFYNIESGKNEIKKRYIYKLYSQFSKDPVSKHSFNLCLGLYLKTNHRDPKESFFLINQKILNLSEKALEFLEKQTHKPRSRSLPTIQHFENFLKKYHIKAAKDDNNWVWVSSDILYNMYDKWKYSIKKSTAISLHEFRQLCKAYFIWKRDEYYFWYKLDNSICTSLPLDKKYKVKTRTRLLNEKEEKQKK